MLILQTVKNEATHKKRCMPNSLKIVHALKTEKDGGKGKLCTLNTITKHIVLVINFLGASHAATYQCPELQRCKIWTSQIFLVQCVYDSSIGMLHQNASIMTGESDMNEDTWPIVY